MSKILLQRMVLFLDNYHQNPQNISNELDAWLYPERLVDMYSKVLEIMHRNTVCFMIEEQKKELEGKDKIIEQLQKQIEELKVSKQI